MASILTAITNNEQMERTYGSLAHDLLQSEPFDRGEVHAQKTTSPEMVTRELRHLMLVWEVPSERSAWRVMVRPNLPWAEDHFQERISGEPLNPPPSERYWPFAQRGNSAHKRNEKFSHTYPERFWPKFANEGGTMHDSERVAAVPHVGLRFEYGDMVDLISILQKNPRSRQAYLPVWFPEDLTAARRGERVPCTLGYHFLLHPNGSLNCSYFMRSCDLVRFFRDDVYMAGRLLQTIAGEIGANTGELVISIANLHAFVGDQIHLKRAAEVVKNPPKKHLNLDALL